MICDANIQVTKGLYIFDEYNELCDIVHCM